MEKSTKVKSNYNISESVLKKFNKTTKEKAINKSGLIEILMIEWLNQNNDGK